MNSYYLLQLTKYINSFKFTKNSKVSFKSFKKVVKLNPREKFTVSYGLFLSFNLWKGDCYESKHAN